MRRELADGEESAFRFWLIDPNGFVSTVKDVTFFNGNRTRKEAGVEFDVGPEPAYVNKKRYNK